MTVAHLAVGAHRASTASENREGPFPTKAFLTFSRIFLGIVVALHTSTFLFNRYFAQKNYERRQGGGRVSAADMGANVAFFWVHVAAKSLALVFAVIVLVYTVLKSNFSRAQTWESGNFYNPLKKTWNVVIVVASLVLVVALWRLLRDLIMEFAILIFDGASYRAMMNAQQAMLFLEIFVGVWLTFGILVVVYLLGRKGIEQEGGLWTRERMGGAGGGKTEEAAGRGSASEGGSAGMV